MVHINKVEIFGFKSFGFKNTIVDFERGLVCISGPNGSGKSNILDAIIFAMGENRPSVMRAAKLRGLMHDIDGSKHGSKITRVSVHFDNSDRKIPVASDSVEITREMNTNGDNTYLLNRKKTARGHILELLNVANAGLHQLNAVQQGTVTQISEYSSEQKRQKIEDLIGLSYFDEKKAEAEKNLEQATRNLDVSLAKMGEIKARIDELDEERNLMLRYKMIGREMGRLKSILASKELGRISAETASKNAELGDIRPKMKENEKERETVRAQIKSITDTKARFMEKMAEFNKKKSPLDSELSLERSSFEDANAAIAAAENTIKKIDARVPQIPSELESLSRSASELESKLGGISDSLEKLDLEKTETARKISDINEERDAVLKRQTDTLRRKSEFDAHIAGLKSKLHDAELVLSKCKMQQSATAGKLQTNTAKLDNHRRSVAELGSHRAKLDSAVRDHAGRASGAESELARLESKKTRTEGDIEDLGMVLDKSSRAESKYGAKIRMVKTMMHEDYTVAKLKANAEKLGILGLVYEMISWDEKYERAVMAVSSDWVKATVVRDFETLLSLAEYTRQSGLPKVRIIPLDSIPSLRPGVPDMPGAVGVLSDYVKCSRKYGALKAFLFGNVILADSAESARRISKAGYRSVTIQGEFFESSSPVVVIDISSKISKLTRIISMSTSVEGLMDSIKLLKKYVQQKKRVHRRLEAGIRECNARLRDSHSALEEATHARDELARKIESSSRLQAVLEARIGELGQGISGLRAEAAGHESQVSELRQKIGQIDTNHSDGSLERIAGELENLNSNRSILEKDRARLLEEYTDRHSSLAGLRGEQTANRLAVRTLEEERDAKTAERAQLESKIKERAIVRDGCSTNLEKLRQKEQEMIAASGTSVETITEYDGQLGQLGSREKELTGQITGWMHRQSTLERDLKELGARRAEQQRDVAGFDADAGPEFDARPALEALESEYHMLAPDLNAKAPAIYIEVSRGYRTMSEKKNQLAGEHERIIEFIESVEKEKRQTFLEAFDTVDKEIRHVFEKMTGGGAWLELENEDDIFSSGISYLIQFRDKQKRESMSLSGGEKTLAAIVFVLALQKLKPSPFYLFDEVDAHLDAPNSASLAKILEERSKSSQFIMVSLKDSVVAKAGLIYGVYARNGVSHVLTYKDGRLPSMATS